MDTINTEFAAKWFTGKALQNAMEALALLNESIAKGYWVGRASVKVPAALSKSNVAKKLSESSKEINTLACDFENGLRETAWSINHNLQFGSFKGLARLDLHTFIDSVNTLEAKALVSKAMEMVADFAPAQKAIEILDRDSAANKKLAEAGDANPMGICACCFRAQKVQPSGNMYQHGYERPGYGFIVGGCPGSDFPPYSV